MAAPSFVDAGTGAPDAGGAWSYTCQANAATDNMFIVQILQDGSTNGAVAVTGSSGVLKLDNTAGWDQIRGPNADGSFPVGGSGEARMFLYIGSPYYPATPTISGTNSTSEDLFIRSYQFQDVSTGTKFSKVIENAIGSTLESEPSGTSSAPIGGSSTSSERQAQSFTASAPISGVKLYLVKNGNPTDSVIVELQSNSGGQPSGTVLATKTIASADLVSASDNFFALPYDCVAGTLYWIVARRSGSLDVANYWNWSLNTSGGYAGGNHSTYYSSAWHSDAGGDERFATIALAGTSVGTSSITADAGVASVGADRLALNFIAVNDDNVIGTFTGETEGDWTNAVSPYADSGGTDGAIGLQVASQQQANLSDLGTSKDIGKYSTYKLAASFVAWGSLSEIATMLAKVGTPSSNLTISIQADSSGLPSGTILASLTLTPSDLTATPTVRWHSLSASLTSGNTYWIVMETGSLSDSNYYVVEHSSPGAGSVSKEYHGGAWYDYATDLVYGCRFGSMSIEGGVGTIVDIDAWGVVGFALIGTTPSGPATYYGVTAMPLVFTKAVAGQKTTFGQTATVFTFTKAVAGVRVAFGQIAAAFTFGKDVAGVRKVFGQITAPFTFIKSVVGQRTTFGQIVESFTVGIFTAGDRVAATFYGIVAAPFIFTKAVAGQRTTFGQIAAPFTFVKDVLGKKTTFGQTGTSFTFTKAVSGVRTTFSSTVTSITVTIGTAGYRVGNTFYGIVTAPFTFTKAVVGQRKTFGQTATLLTFGKDVRGFKTTFAQVAAQFTFTKAVSGIRTTFSSTTTSITATIATAGYRVGNTLYGIVAAPFVFSKSVIGQKTTFGQVAVPFTFVKDVIGHLGAKGVIVSSFTFGKDVAGRRTTFSSLVSPFTFTKDVIGRLGAKGAIVAQFTFGKDVAAHKTTFGQTAIPVVFSKAVVGQRKTFSQIAAPFTFTKAVLGKKTTFAQIDMPVTFYKEVAGRKQTFAQVAFPIDLAFSVVAEVQGIRYGATSMSLVFDKQVAGQRKTFSQIVSPYIFAPAVQGMRTTFGRFDSPFIFTKAVIGQRKTFGQIVFPIQANIAVSGRRMAFGSLAMGLIFSEQTAGQRKAFGRILSPYLFAITTQAKRETFGQIDTDFDFLVDVDTGRVEAFSQLAFEILIGLETMGFVRPKGIILNLAKEIYLGSTPVDSVYTDGQKVWPPTI